MATIDVSGAFRTKNDVLRRLLHKGTNPTLRFFKHTSNSVGGMEEVVTVANGWNHKQSKDPQSGKLEEILTVSESSSVTEEVIKISKGCDIVYDVDDFERYTFGEKSQLNPITHEWRIILTLNKADKRPLNT